MPYPFFFLPLLFQFACVIFENNVVIKLYFMHLQKNKRKNPNEKTFRLVEFTSNNVHSVFIWYYFLLCLSAMRANLILSNRRHTQPFLYFAFSGSQYFFFPKQRFLYGLFFFFAERENYVHIFIKLFVFILLGLPITFVIFILFFFLFLFCTFTAFQLTSSSGIYSP